MSEEEIAAAAAKDAEAKAAEEAGKEGQGKTEEELAVEAKAAEENKGKSEEELAAEKKAAEEKEDAFDYSAYEVSEDDQKELDTAFDGMSNDQKKQVLDWYSERSKLIEEQSSKSEEDLKKEQDKQEQDIVDAWDKQSREDPLLGKDYDKYDKTEEEVLKKHLSEDEIKNLKGFIFLKHPTMRKLISQIGNDYSDDKIEHGKATSGDAIKRDSHGNIILSYDKTK